MPNVLKHTGQSCTMKYSVTNANNTLLEKHGMPYKSIEVHLSTMSCHSVLILDRMRVLRGKKGNYGVRGIREDFIEEVAFEKALERWGSFGK